MDAGGFLVAFCAFPIPAVHPKGYWLWHSIWHLGCAFAFFELYRCLDTIMPHGRLWVASTNGARSCKPKGSAVSISVKTHVKGA